MKTLPYIEDYIELMSRHHLSWPPLDPVIKMARYDEPIVTSMTDQIQRSQGFTDRQSSLAHKIVIKYKKQWTAAGYDVSAHDTNPQFRLPIRVVDRSQRIDIEDQRIIIRFPYNQELISAIRACVDSIPGSLIFDNKQRAWVTSAVEPRVIWAKEFGTKYNFEFGAEFDQRLAELLGTPDYEILLDIEGDQAVIRNAESTLIDYVESKIGLTTANLVQLADHGTTLAYTVSSQVRSMIDSQYGLYELLYAAEQNIVYEHEPNIKPVLDYAKLTDRYPIYVYESGGNSIRQQLERYFTAEQMLMSGLHLHREVPHGVQCVYFSNWRQAPARMPLLITAHTLVIGHRRQQVRQTAEKIVYYTHQPNVQSPTTNT